MFRFHILYVKNEIGIRFCIQLQGKQTPCNDMQKVCHFVLVVSLYFICVGI